MILYYYIYEQFIDSGVIQGIQPINPVYLELFYLFLSF